MAKIAFCTPIPRPSPGEYILAAVSATLTEDLLRDFQRDEHAFNVATSKRCGESLGPLLQQRTFCNASTISMEHGAVENAAVLSALPELPNCVDFTVSQQGRNPPKVGLLILRFPECIPSSPGVDPLPGGKQSPAPNGSRPQALEVLKSTLQSGYNCLRPVVSFQPHQNHTDMALYGRFCDSELSGNFLVALTVDHQGQHFTLARA